MTKQKKASLVLEAIEQLPGGFIYDWPMSWEESEADAVRAGRAPMEYPENYPTDGLGDWDTLPKTAEDASDEALEYERKVITAIDGARSLERLAREAALVGDLDRSAEFIRDAADLESQFGDCPSYQDSLDLLDAAEDLDDD